MGKIVTVIILVFAGVAAYLAVYNMEPVSVALTKDLIYQIPKIGLMLISAVAGAFLMFVIYTMRDTRRLIRNIQTQRRQKKEEKIQNQYSRALGAMHSKRPDIAENALKEVLKEEPGHLQALLRLGEIAEERDEVKAALDYYKRALAADPGNQETLLHLLTAKEKMGAHEEALGYADEIIEKDEKNLLAIQKKREILEGLGRWEDLMELQKLAIKRAATDEDKAREERLLLGYTYESGRESLEKGDLEKAKKLFRTVIKADRAFIPAHLGMAEVIDQEDGPESAVSYLEKVYRDEKSIIVLARLEDLILGLGEPSRIINIYKKGLSENPSDNLLKFFLAKLYYRLEMLDDALEMIEGIETPSAYPEIRKIRGGIYMKRGQYEKATEEFRSALNMRMTLRIPYCCSVCAFKSDEWSGRCPSCGSWNTYYFNIHGACKIREG
jgi:lipopolysaccharide biosynthesis regulator YciM